MIRNYCLVLALALLSACGDSPAPKFTSAPGDMPTPLPTPEPGLMPIRAQTLEGSQWFLQYVRPAGSDEKRQMPLTAPFTLQLQRNRSVSGYADCNAFTGEYSYLNDAMQINLLGFDAAVCEDEGGRDTAAINDVMTMLQDVAWFELRKNALTLETYGEGQLVFEPLFGGCSAPRVLTGENSSSAVVIVGEDAEELAELVVEYQIAHEDFVLQDASGQTVARMSDNTLQRLRCDSRVASLQYWN